MLSPSQHEWTSKVKNHSSIVDPDLLEIAARKMPLRVFLCGPGLSSSGFDARTKMRSLLERKYHAKVDYGEDLEHQKSRSSRLVDLQTLESQFAHTVDFTILILDSPGAIAELGTFSMIPNIMARLFVVVSSQYHRSNSYIARGPLSLISSYNTNNIIYYDKDDETSLSNGLMYPVCLYKFAKFDQGYTYQRKAIQKFRGRRFSRSDYTDYFNPIRRRFSESIVLAAVNILQNPTFTELVSRLRLDPNEISGALPRLMEQGAIQKVGNRNYRAPNGYSDQLLRPFNSTSLSKRRAEILATT